MLDTKQAPTSLLNYTIVNQSSGTRHCGLITEVTMTDEELELSILEKYVARHQQAETADPRATDKCARELDMREVLRELTGEEGANLSYIADLWIGRLAPPSPGRSKGPLRRCSNSDLNTSDHKFHARAFQDPANDAPAPAWDRIRELREKLSVQGPVAPTKELEQRFSILLSPRQEQRDFDTWCDDARDQGNPIGVLFVDIDHFKRLNTRYTEFVVDQTILPEAQKLLKRLTAHRGGAYGHGGDEFVVVLPNHDREEVMAFAEKVRGAFEAHEFQVDDKYEELTVTIGAAIWPDHGEALSDVLEAANKAENLAKKERRNTVRMLVPRHVIAEADNQLEGEGKAAMLGLAHPFLHPFLAWYYSVELWTQEGQAFPAVVFPLATPKDATSTGSVLGPWDCANARATLEEDEDWACLDRRYVNLRKRARRRIENRQTFCLQKILLEDDLPIVHSNLTGYYEDCLATCDALEWELLVAFGSTPPTSSEPEEFARFSESRLPLRQAGKSFANEKGSSPYLTGAGRSAAIAVATFTLAKRPDGSFVTFLGHRSAKTAAHPHLLHVAPSGMLQPIWHWQNPAKVMNSPYYKAEWSLRNHVLREVVEELFSIDFEKELADRPPETPDVILGHPEVKFLDDLMNSGGAKLFVTGVLVNLLNLRTEIATVLLIHDPIWYERHSRGTDGLPTFASNWEFLNYEELKKQDLPRFWHSPVWTPSGDNDSRDLLSRIGSVSPENFVVPGAVTLLLGLQFARTILETKC